MRDVLTAGVRTGIQVAVAAIVAWLTQRGIEVDEQALEIALFSVATGVITMLLNVAQAKFPILGVILSLGLSKSTPTY